MVDDADDGEPLSCCESGAPPRNEARCPSCGVILTSAERGLGWPPEDDDEPDPLCTWCKAEAEAAADPKSPKAH